MRVLYDHQIFNAQHYGGISKYFAELGRSLRYNRLIEVRLSIARTENIHLRESQLLDSTHPSSVVRGFLEDFLDGQYNFPGKGRLFNLIRQLRGQKRLDLSRPGLFRSSLDRSICKIREGEYDLLHPTYYDPYFLDHRGGKPYVITVHDMIHEIFPQFFKAEDLTAQHKRQTIDGATRLIAVSKQTRDDLIRIAGIDPDRVEVVHHGVASTKEEPFPLPDNFILFVGSRRIYKNFQIVARAFAALRLRHPRLILVCCGGGDWSKEELQFFNEIDIAKRVRLFHPTDRQLAYAYSKARLFIYPSLYEGFGMPILEAALRRAPVCASRIGAFSEIAEDSVLYFDPDSLESVIDSIETLLEDRQLRQSLTELAWRRAKDFTWERTAHETARVYQKLR